MKRMSIVVLFGLLALFSAGCQRVTGGNFVLPRGATVSDDLYISGGDSTLEQGSRVTGSLIVQGGEIHIDGEIDGDVPVSGGDIVFGPSAIVRGEVQRSGGSVSFAPGASIRYTDRTTVSYGTRAPARGLETFILIPLLFIAIVGILLTLRSGSSMVTGTAGVQTAESTGSQSNLIRALSQRATQRGGAIALGIILMVLGFLFFLQQLLNLSIWRYGWPVLILVAGFLFFAVMVFGGRETATLAIPGSIITMIGLILLYQNAFDRYQTWSYAWALILPTSIGMGRYIQGWWGSRPDLRARGTVEIRIGLILFVVLAVFFEMFLNPSGFFTGALSRYAFPLLLMGIGVSIVLSLGLNRPSPNGSLQSRPQTESSSAAQTSDTLPPSGD